MVELGNPLDQNKFKLNVDASVNFHSRVATIGGLIRDSLGLCKGAVNDRI